MSTDPNQLLVDRRRAIRSRIEKLRAELDGLVAEQGELDITARTLARLQGKPAPAEGDEATDDWDAAESEETPTIGELLTLPQMVVTILEEAKAEGAKGVTGPEIFATIRKRWKPNAKQDNVRPTLWRMVQKDRLLKRGKLYKLPPEASHGAAAADLLGQSPK